MTRILLIFVFFMSFSLNSYKTDNNLEREKYLNFVAAIENDSTFGYFTVIKVKNIRTGETKEVCTKGNFISGAVHIELNANYDAKGEKRVLEFIKSKRTRFFEFRNAKALDNISFFEYDTKQLSIVRGKYAFDKVGSVIKRDKSLVLQLGKNEMKYFAHLLFNQGYMTGENDCFGGTLEFVDRNKK